MKICPASSVVRRMQMKAMKYHFLSTREVKINKPDLASFGCDGGNRIFHTLLSGYLEQSPLKAVWQYLVRLKVLNKTELMSG